MAFCRLEKPVFAKIKARKEAKTVIDVEAEEVFEETEEDTEN